MPPYNRTIARSRWWRLHHSMKHEEEGMHGCRYIVTCYFIALTLGSTHGRYLAMRASTYIHKQESFNMLNTVQIIPPAIYYHSIYIVKHTPDD